MKCIAFYALLERAERHLLPNYILQKCLQVTIWCGAGWAGTICLLRLLGWPAVSVWLWEAGTLLGVCGGLVAGWRHRPTPTAIAGWLDRQLQTDEAFAATLFCLKRGCSGRLDPLVVERAELLAAGNPQIQWPWRKLLRPAGMMSLLQMAVLGSCLWIAPALDIHWHHQTGAKGRIQPLSKDGHRQKESRAPALSAHMIARQLFPHNPRLAADLERALQSGDAALTERMLGQAITANDLNDKTNAEIRRRLFNAARDYQKNRNAPGEEGRLAMERSGPGNRDQTSSPGRQPGTNGNGSGKSDLAQSNQGYPTGGSGKQHGSNPHMPSGQEYGYQPGNGIPGSPGGGLASGGSKAGKGRGSDRGNWNTILPGKSQQKALVQQDGDTLEFVLPGQNAKLPLGQMVPAYQQASEAALLRKGVPGEYQDYVRTYFQELSDTTTAQ